MILQHISTDDIITELDSDFENLSTMSSPVLSTISSVSTSCNDGKDNSAMPAPETSVLENNGKLASNSFIIHRWSQCRRFLVRQTMERRWNYYPLCIHLFLSSRCCRVFISRITPTSVHNFFSLTDVDVLTIDIQSAITPLIRGDLKTFTSYACRIEELVLTDVGRDEHPRVSQDVITRLCLIQDINAPFLSSLKRLRLINVDSELSYLWLCVTPSLEALDISHIPPTRQSTIAAFLSELVGSAPRLAHLTLGHGQLSPTALRVSVHFTHLRTLRINVCGLLATDAAAAFSFGFLEAVAALPELALFELDSSTAEYTPYTPLADDLVTGRHDGDMPGAALREEPPAPFSCLKVLTVVGTVLVMHDLIYRLLPRCVEQVSLTLVRHGVLPIPAHWLPMLPASCKLLVDELLVDRLAVNSHLQGEHATSLAPLATFVAEVPPALPREETDEPLLPEIPYHTFNDLWGDTTIICEGDRSLNTSSICPECREKRRLREEPLKGGKRKKSKRLDEAQLERERLERLEAQRAADQYMQEERRREEREFEEMCRAQQLREAEDSNILSQTTYFASAIEHVFEGTKPRSVYINHANLSSSSTSIMQTMPLDPPELPLTTLRRLLSCPSLVKLEIENWVLASINETLLDLGSPSEPPLPMQILHLPLTECFNSGVALSALSSIAQLYPSLLEFQTRVVQCAGDFVRELELSITDHGLKELSFGGESPGPMEYMLKITPYICFLFPHLERITTHYGHGAEGWKSVHELIKMCQHVRDTYKQNFHRSA